MSIALTDEAAEIAAVLRGFLARHAPEPQVRAAIGTEFAFDRALWDRMAGELQLQALIVPERFGGVGFGWIELGAAFEELGYALACVPYFSTIGLAANALLASGDDDACAEYLPGIADGSTIATLAIEGTDQVTDGAVADLVLVATADGLFVAEDVAREPLETLDLTRRMARLTYAPGHRIGDERAARRALDLAAVALAAEQVGGAQRMLDLAVAYAKDRVQFGRPIGAFQSVKHKLADLLVEVETARAVAYHALGAAARGDDHELAAASAVAQAWCSDAFLHVAEESLQVHGGIGMTWEHPAHLYLRRAKSSQALLGDPAHHRGRLAALLDKESMVPAIL